MIAEQTIEARDDREPSARPGGKTAGATILIVDDEHLVRFSLQAHLERQGYAVRMAASAENGLRALDDDVDLVLLDCRLPDGDGLRLLRRIKAAQPGALVIMMTAHSTVDMAVEAMRCGAYHYTSKPCDLEWLSLTVARALESNRLQREVRTLRQQRGASLHTIVGASPAMRHVKELLARVAESPASTVLLTGETGTGKDLAARVLHSCGTRADRSFLNITCSALPSALLESELFGHERGAFTDAKLRKKGLFEHADGGTVFLDEIGEMEPALQSKLLRFLEEKAFRRVGGNGDIRADVRVIAATNVDLQRAVVRQTFREDLYYRLAVVPIHLPPLRDRHGDIEQLAATFIDGFNREFNRRVSELTREASALLAGHNWPGNVRELRNAIERAMLLTRRERLGADDFRTLAPRGPAPGEPEITLPPGGIDIRELEKKLVIQALQRASGNQSRAATLLRMTRDQIRYRIEKYGLANSGPPKGR